MADTTATVAATATSWSCVATPFRLSTFQCDDLSYGDTNNTALYILPVVGDADIAGIGVIVAFLVSAYVTLLSALIAYWGGFLPDNLLTTYDIRFMKARKMRSEEKRKRWSHVLVKAILVISDQQIVTGISILLAGYIQIMSMSVYHWQIIIYLAWMCSNTHLTTLTVLRDHLKERTVLKKVRLVGMLILLVLLFIGFLPTVTYFWAAAQLARKGNPVRCYWNRWESGANPDAVLSLVILVAAYIWKLLYVFCEGDRKFRRLLLERPLERLETAVRCNLIRPVNGRVARWWRTYRHRSLVVVYLWVVVVSDFAESFAASLLLLTGTLAWGSLQLFSARSVYPHLDGSSISGSYIDPFIINGSVPCIDASEVADVQNQWGFGQLLPLLLLTLPLLAVVEEVYNDYTNHDGHDPILLNDASTLQTPCPRPLVEDAAECSQPRSRFTTLLDAEKAERAALLYKSRFFRCLLVIIILPFYVWFTWAITFAMSNFYEFLWLYGSMIWAGTIGLAVVVTLLGMCMSSLVS